MGLPLSTSSLAACWQQRSLPECLRTPDTPQRPSPAGKYPLRRALFSAVAAVAALFLLLINSAAIASYHPAPTAAARQCKPQALAAHTPDEQSKRFVSCWNNAMMSPPQRHVAQCAREYMPNQQQAKAGLFALCSQGVKVPKQAADVMACVGKANGGVAAAASCSAAAKLNPEQTRAVQCLANNRQDTKQATACIADANLSPEQQRDLACVQANPKDVNKSALCIGVNHAHLSSEQQHAVQCVKQHSSDPTGSALCIASGHLSAQDRALVGCVTDHRSDAYAAAVCAGGTRLSPEQQRLASCAAKYASNPYAAALCAGGGNLTPEQMIVAQCAISTMMEPHAFAACVTEQLTQAELQKCLLGKIGGDDGCFGKNNDLVKAIQAGFNGAKALAGGPNSMVNNPDQIFGGPNSFARNPAQVWGGDNSVVKNPGQIFGGSNSIFNNPCGDLCHGSSEDFLHKPLGNLFH
jgi:hypothetical protein